MDEITPVTCTGRWPIASCVATSFRAYASYNVGAVVTYGSAGAAGALEELSLEWSSLFPNMAPKMPRATPITSINAHPAATGEVFLFGGAFGRPHFRQTGASVEISVPQSGHFIRAISVSPRVSSLGSGRGNYTRQGEPETKSAQAWSLTEGADGRNQAAIALTTSGASTT